MKNSYKFIVIIRHNINEYLENYSSACEGQIIATKWLHIIYICKFSIQLFFILENFIKCKSLKKMKIKVNRFKNI